MATGSGEDRNRRGKYPAEWYTTSREKDTPGFFGESQPKEK